MARHEVDEEPFDLDIDGGEKDDDFEFEFNDENEEDVEALSEDEEDGDDDSNGPLTDEDLDSYKRDRDDARNAAAEARAAVATMQAEKIAKANAERDAAIKNEKDKLTARMTVVKAKLKEAFDDADSDAHVKLTEELADLKGQERLLAVVEEQARAAAGTPQAPKVHPKAQAWVQKNDWFNENAEARTAAVAYANTLEASGIMPNDDEYYKRIDAHMKRRYPELFKGGAGAASKKRKTASPVTSGAREGASSSSERGVKRQPRQVKLSPLQVRIAKQWGIPKEKMAAEVLKQQRRDEGK